MHRIIGIDAGSKTLKIVSLIRGKIERFIVVDSHPKIDEQFLKIRDDFSEGMYIATGYGREVLRDKLGLEVITEIAAFARGAREFFPNALGIIDLGGQDTKVINLNKDGLVLSFDLNDRCAAGTGKFLEFMARSLNLSLDEFICIAQEAEEAVHISNTCAVFAESEVISLIAGGENISSIALGLHEGIAKRISIMSGKLKLKFPIVFAGGGALNSLLVRLLEKSLGCNLLIPPNPQIIGAYGAALILNEKTWDGRQE